MDKLIMTFKIYVDEKDISSVEGPFGGVCFIPFHGEVTSDIFSGKIRPGACDVQTVNFAKVRNMCAKYLFEGTDKEGKPCKLFVHNEGWTTLANSKDSFIEAVPRFITDSPQLGEYLCQNRFRSEVHSTGPNSLDIRIFEVNA